MCPNDSEMYVQYASRDPLFSGDEKALQWRERCENKNKNNRHGGSNSSEDVTMSNWSSRNKLEY